jgi:hypothetical protein
MVRKEGKGDNDVTYLSTADRGWIAVRSNTMKVPPPKLAGREFLAIAKTIAAPDSRPGRMMTVKKKNSANHWSEKADSKRARASLDDFQANFDKAAEKLASEPMP